jgi:Fe2+ transport system protein B
MVRQCGSLGFPSLQDLSASEELAVNDFLLREPDLILFLLDASKQWSDDHLSQIRWLLAAGKPLLVLLSRADLVPEPEIAALMKEVERRIGLAPVPVSAQTGLNVEKIRDILLWRSSG